MWCQHHASLTEIQCSVRSCLHVTIEYRLVAAVGLNWYYSCSSRSLDTLLISLCSVCLVAEDISVHQLERLVELLTSKECKDLLFTLSHPEENIFQHLEHLSAGNNQLDLKPRAKRDTTSAEG